MEKVRNKDLVNRKRFSSSLKNELEESLTNLADNTRIPKSKLLDEAIADLLKKYGVKLNKGTGEPKQ